MKRTFTVMAAALAFALTLAGCSSSGGSSGDSSAGSSDKPLTIGLILLQGDTYFQGIQSATEAAVKADGGKVITSLSNGDAGTEATVAQNMIQSNVDAIMMQPAAGAASIATMKSITAAGIPLICYGNCLDDATDPSIVKGVIQSDNTALGTGTGELAATYIKDKLDGKANIGILNCDVASACKLRKAGFKQALSDAGVDATYVTDQEGFLADKATTVATNVLSANSQINLLWASNEGGTVGATIAVKQANKTLPVFGTDISTQIGGFLTGSDDILQVSTGQDAKATAEGAYEMAKNAVAGKENQPLEVELPGVTFSRDDPAAIKQFLAQ